MLLTENAQVDIFVASRIGSFKHIKFHTELSKNNKKNIENLVDIKTLAKDDSVTCMEWGNREQTEILIGRRNQQIQIYSTTEGFKDTYSSDFASGDIVGIGRCKEILLAGVASGTVKLWNGDEEDVVEIGGKIDRMVVCGDDEVFATGGEENDLKVYRIGESDAIFSAKNLPHDWLQLRRPIWVTDACFLPGEGGKLMAVCSRHGYVRLYDTRAQRRPVCNVDFEKMAATCLTPALEDRQVLVGFGRGQLHQVDLRVGKLSKGYKGCVGAVTGIATDRHRRLVVSCSLDRRVRVHQADSKELLYEQYLTSKLSRVLVQTESSTPLRKKTEEIKEGAEERDEVKIEDLDDMDVIFDRMETIGDKSKKKKQELKKKDPEVVTKKIKPSTEGSTTDLDQTDEAIVKLLRSTEKQKRRIEKKKKEKKTKSVFHNA